VLAEDLVHIETTAHRLHRALVVGTVAIGVRVLPEQGRLELIGAPCATGADSVDRGAARAIWHALARTMAAGGKLELVWDRSAEDPSSSDHAPRSAPGGRQPYVFEALMAIARHDATAVGEFLQSRFEGIPVLGRDAVHSIAAAA